ncbi:hypothetical protein ABKN59_002645 [Abortiporus biennis]
MGGNAFNLSHPNAQFPRLDTNTYTHLKQENLSALQKLYEFVIVPHEAPEKADHGDVDYVVFKKRQADVLDVVHAEDIQIALGATWFIPSLAKNGFGTSNFAIPWPVDAEEGKSTSDSSAAASSLDTIDYGKYYQVDVHVCPDKDDFDRVEFFKSYGDLGMIVGLICRSIGLSFSSNGLRFSDPLPTYPQITFHLSKDFPDILSFLDTANNARRKARDARPMYQNFLKYVRSIAGTSNNGDTQVHDPSSVKEKGKHRERKQAIMSNVLTRYGKRALYDALLRVASIKQHVKDVYTGRLVTEWTGVQGTPVRWIMNEVERRLGERTTLESDNILKSLKLLSSESMVEEDSDSIKPVHLQLESWEVALDDMDRDEVKSLVVEVKEEMEKEGKLYYDWKAAKEKKASIAKAASTSPPSEA